MNLSSPSRATITWLCLLLLSCSTAAPVTQLPEQRDVTTLNPDETRQLCTDITTFFVASFDEPTRREFDCGISASISVAFAKAFSQDPRAACEKSLSECRAAPAKPQEGDGGIELTGCTFEKCRDVTVGQVSACAREQRAAIQALTVSCDSILAPDAGTLGPACAQYQSRCRP